MGLIIVEAPIGTGIHAIEALVTRDGVILINLGTNPEPAVKKEVGKIAIPFEWEGENVYYTVKEKDHFLGLWSLSQVFVDFWIRLSDIGKMNAHKLQKMGVATQVT